VASVQRLFQGSSGLMFISTSALAKERCATLSFHIALHKCVTLASLSFRCATLIFGSAFLWAQHGILLPLVRDTFSMIWALRECPGLRPRSDL
jgi:hypothetical protein